jgi:hypothetical protein
MMCENANAMQKCENSHGIAKKWGKKRENWSINRSFAIAFTSHYQPCHKVMACFGHGFLYLVIPCSYVRILLRHVTRTLVVVHVAAQNTPAPTKASSRVPWWDSHAIRHAVRLANGEKSCFSHLLFLPMRSHVYPLIASCKANHPLLGRTPGPAKQPNVCFCSTSPQTF